MGSTCYDDAHSENRGWGVRSLPEESCSFLVSGELFGLDYREMHPYDSLPVLHRDFLMGGVREDINMHTYRCSYFAGGGLYEKNVNVLPENSLSALSNKYLLSALWGDVATHGSPYLFPEDYRVNPDEESDIQEFIGCRPVVASFLDHFREELGSMYGLIEASLSLFNDFESGNQEIVVTLKFEKQDYENILEYEDNLFEKLNGKPWFNSALEFMVIEYDV